MQILYPARRTKEYKCEYKPLLKDGALGTCFVPRAPQDKAISLRPTGCPHRTKLKGFFVVKHAGPPCVLL